MSDASVPSQLGRYRILSKLGQGGMGSVYLAEDTVLSRRVAVKVPHFSAADGPKVIERFHREARVAAAIDHPNICPVHDAGEVNGVHYLVMPLVEGTPLSQLIDEDDPWPPARAAALVRQLALAIEVLHQRGLIHRDLKPSNVLLRANGEPVLMDFGLARSFTEQTRRLTQTGAALGTPAYMAPEQILGDVKAIGPATDVYEMGVVLYELLTGCLPFEGPPAAVYGQILHAQPEPPSARRPGLDAALDPVCLKALAKKPAERFASMAALAEALVLWACPVAVISEPTIPALSEAPPLVEPSPVPRLTCPGCGKSLKVPPTTIGKRLQCPRCRTILAAAATTQDRSPPNRAGADTAAPSLVKTVAAPPPGRVRQRGTRAGRQRRLVWLALGVPLLAVAIVIALLSSAGDSGTRQKQVGSKDKHRPPVEKPTDKLPDKDKPVEKPTERPTDNGKPADKVADKHRPPVEKPTDKSSDKDKPPPPDKRPTDKPTDNAPKKQVSSLLTNKSVQEELKLSKDQKDKLAAISKDMREAFGKLRDLSREERQQKLQALMTESTEKTKKVGESLTSEQKKRLKQIETQQLGLRAFTDKDVQAALKLTDAQKTAIKEISEGVQKKVAEETKNLTGGERFTKGREIRTKLNKEAMGKIASKLTSEQKKTWKELVGAPFEIKFEGFGRPGGGRRLGAGRRGI